MSDVFTDAASSLRKAVAVESHPLTIPGELLAEACELGNPGIDKWTGGWGASIALNDFGGLIKTEECNFNSPAEALQAAIDEAREAAK